MAYTPKILAFAGSTRSESLNKKLIRVGAEAAREAGAEVTLIDLRDYPLPLYDGDLEARDGLPENGRKLKDLFLANDGLLISSPEYNNSFSAVFKNTIDWVSRPVEGYPPLECFTGKVAGLMSASPGYFGGMRGLFDVRKLLSMIAVDVLPDQVAVPKANTVFNDNGELTDEGIHKRVVALGARLTDTINKLKG
ncbi:NADPH-dependent FMN reductase [candidate division GN15 bacterium]|nr:NADPH-dependent FMN reductase [candidate division GN15 bacterium]